MCAYGFRTSRRIKSDFCRLKSCLNSFMRLSSQLRSVPRKKSLRLKVKREMSRFPTQSCSYLHREVTNTLKRFVSTVSLQDCEKIPDFYIQLDRKILMTQALSEDRKKRPIFVFRQHLLHPLWTYMFLLYLFHSRYLTL